MSMMDNDNATRDEGTPILAHWKMREVLKRYPHLLDTLIAISPRFAALRNPVVRRVQGQLVTVAQAARVAGLEPAALVATLNRAAGFAPIEFAPAVAAAPATVAADQTGTWPADAPVAEELDVRPYQERGEEPLGAIMAAVGRVPVGQTLRLRNTFEPTPLYDVLGKRGFVARASVRGPEDWEILFLNTGRADRVGAAPGPAPTARPAADTAPAPLAWQAPAASLTIDVSELVPPEPLVKIMEALEALPPGETLLVHHVRRPIHLYPRLDALGCRHETREIAPGRIELLIAKPDATADAGRR
jgi:uncharacterized protein (DUF2249 family)